MKSRVKETHSDRTVVSIGQENAVIIDRLSTRLRFPNHGVNKTRSRRRAVVRLSRSIGLHQSDCCRITKEFPTYNTPLDHSPVVIARWTTGGFVARYRLIEGTINIYVSTEEASWRTTKGIDWMKGPHAGQHRKYHLRCECARLFGRALQERERERGRKREKEIERKRERERKEKEEKKREKERGRVAVSHFD